MTAKPAEERRIVLALLAHASQQQFDQVQSWRRLLNHHPFEAGSKQSLVTVPSMQQHSLVRQGLKRGSCRESATPSSQCSGSHQKRINCKRMQHAVAHLHVCPGCFCRLSSTLACAAMTQLIHDKSTYSIKTIPRRLRRVNSSKSCNAMSLKQPYTEESSLCVARTSQSQQSWCLTTRSGTNWTLRTRTSRRSHRSGWSRPWA